MTMEAKTAQGTQKEVNPMDVIALLLGELKDMRTELNNLKNGGGNGTTKKGRAPRPAVRCVDTKTGNVYHSHASAGMAVAPEFGLKVHNFVWYEVIVKAPGRFKDMSDVEYQAVLKANAEKLEKKVEAPATQSPPPTKANPPTGTNMGKQGK